jgi:chromosome segregation ATPase
LASVVHDIKGDPVLNQMMKDNASAAHVLDRITEIIKIALSAEQEYQISKLLQQLSAKSVECVDYRREAESIAAQLEASQRALEKQSALVDQQTSKIRELKTSLKALKKIDPKMVEKSTAQVAELYEKIGSLEHDLTIRDSQLRKKKQQHNKYAICFD